MERYTVFTDGRFNGVMMSILPPRKTQCSPNQNPSMLFLVEIDKLILKFIWKCKGPRVAKITLKKSTVRELILPDFKLQ